MLSLEFHFQWHAHHMEGVLILLLDWVQAWILCFALIWIQTQTASVCLVRQQQLWIRISKLVADLGVIHTCLSMG